MCCEYQVPFILVPNLSEIKSIIGISSLTCISLSHKVKESNSPFLELFQLFDVYISKFNEHFCHDPCITGKPSPSVVEELKNELESVSIEPEFKFKYPPLEELMISVEQAKDYFCTEKPIVSLDTSQDVEMEFVSFIESEKYFDFPDRPFFENYNVKIDPNILPQSLKGKDFAASLFSSKLPQNKNLQLTSQSSANSLFREPKIVHLPVSNKGKNKPRKTKKKS